MTPGPVDVRRLRADDAPAYRALMLQAYVEAADAFTSTAEERQAEPLSWWVQRIASPSRSLSFGAFDGERLVGTVALELSAKPKTSHGALVIGMFVAPPWRGRGAARRLMQALIDEARTRPGLRRLNLTATEGNAAALALYASLGFVAWGVEPEAILTPSGFRGKVHMSLELAR